MDSIGHWRSPEGLAGVKMPKNLAGFCIDGLKGFCVVTEEDQPPGGGQDTAPGVPFPYLRITPGASSIRKMEREQNLLHTFPGRELGAGVVKSFALHKFLGFCKEQIATLKSHDIEKTRVRAIGRREPVGGAVDTGTNCRSLRGGNQARKNRTA